MISPFESSNGTLDAGGITGGQRWFPIWNTEEEEIPQWSVVEIMDGYVDDSGKIYAMVRKPTGDAGAILALTGRLKTPAASSGTPPKNPTGMATRDGPAWMAFQGSDPTTGDLFGAIEGSWLGDSSGSDFTVIGPTVNPKSGTPSDSDVKRVLVVLTASAPQTIRVGLTGNLYSDGVWWISLYDMQGSPWRLQPDGVGNVGQWKQTNSSGGPASASLLAKDPDNPDDSTWATCVTPNSTANFTLSAVPDLCDQIQTCNIVCRAKYDVGNDLGLRVRVVQSDETTALTDWAVLPVSGSTFQNYSASPTITGNVDKTTWNGAKLQMQTLSGSGQISASAAYVKISFTVTDFSAGPSGSLKDTGKKVKAYARLGAITSQVWVYITKFKWGYEILNAECSGVD